MWSKNGHDHRAILNITHGIKDRLRLKKKHYQEVFYTFHNKLLRVDR